jgi:RNA polymerase sigma-70 factor (ECF subfamily)
MTTAGIIEPSATGAPPMGWAADARPATMAQSIFAAFPSVFGLSDEQAMWRVQAHDDPDAFARLVTRWQEPIRGLCTRMTGDPHRGEDLAQEAFARLFAKRKEYQPRARFSTYLWRIALNLSYDELRRVKRHPEVALDPTAPESDAATVAPWADVGPAPSPTPAAAALASEEAALVREALLALPELYRSVVVLRHYENLKFCEISEVLGIPEGTVKSRMAEALAQLARRLAPALRPAQPRMPSPRPNQEDTL